MKKTDFFWSAAILILILLSLLLPHSGPTALFGAFMRAAAIACALFFVAFRIIKSRPRQALRQQAMPATVTIIKICYRCGHGIQNLQKIYQ